MYLHINLCYSGELLTALTQVEHKNTLSVNFQKSDKNTNTWKFGRYDIPSERHEFNLYGSIC